MRIAAADLGIELAARIGEAFRTPPLRQHFGVGPGFEHQRARRIERARDGDFTFGERFHHDGYTFPYCATSTIQPTPNLSDSMPKRDEKNVFAIGIFTLPPSASALKMRSASASVEALSASAMP